MVIFVAFNSSVKLSGVFKVISGCRFSLNFMTNLNARIICILTLGQRRSTFSMQTTIDAQMRLNQYVGTMMAQRYHGMLIHVEIFINFVFFGATLVQRCPYNANYLPTVLTIFQRWANVIMLSGKLTSKEI